MARLWIVFFVVVAMVSAAAFQAHAQRSWKEPPSPIGIHVLEPAVDQPPEPVATYLQREDLEAQRGMAVAAFVQIGVGLLSAVLLFVTFQQTRSSMRAALRSQEIAQWDLFLKHRGKIDSWIGQNKSDFIVAVSSANTVKIWAKNIGPSSVTVVLAGCLVAPAGTYASMLAGHRIADSAAKPESKYLIPNMDHTFDVRPTLIGGVLPSTALDAFDLLLRLTYEGELGERITLHSAMRVPIRAMNTSNIEPTAYWKHETIEREQTRWTGS